MDRHQMKSVLEVAAESAGYDAAIAAYTWPTVFAGRHAPQ